MKQSQWMGVVDLRSFFIKVMADNKKGFVLYCDLIYTVNQLTNSKAGVLFKHILSYVNDEKPQTNDLIIKISFEPIKQQLKRDLKKWDKETKDRSDAGKKGMESRWKEHNKAKQNITKDNGVNNKITNITDTVTVKGIVKGTVIVNDINKRKVQFRKLLTPFLNVHNKDLLKNFYEYWSEHNENGKKMRFEYAKNQPFNIQRRLTTWFNRQQDFKKEKSSSKKEKSAYEVIQDIKYGIKTGIKHNI